MSGTTDPGARRFRGCLLAGLTALLTAVGHLAGGGALPDLALLVVLGPALAWPVVAVADRCRGTVGALVVLGGGQLLLHELLSSTHAHHTAGDSPSMLLTHTLVTLLTAAALRFADRGVAAVVAALGRVAPRRAPAAVADRPLAVLVVPGDDVPAAVSRVLSATHARRGPPVRC